MWTLKNIAAIGLAIYGTTFLWLLPSFVVPQQRAESGLWTLVQITVFATLLGFAAAGWGLYRGTGWWEITAIASATVSLLALLPWWIAARPVATVVDIAPNAAIHVIGSAVVLAMLLIPVLEQWLARHL